MTPVDPQCYQLAVIFLADEPAELRTPEMTEALAIHVQAAIDDWFESLKNAKDPQTQNSPQARK